MARGGVPALVRALWAEVAAAQADIRALVVKALFLELLVAQRVLAVAVEVVQTMRMAGVSVFWGKVRAALPMVARDPAGWGSASVAVAEAPPRPTAPLAPKAKAVLCALCGASVVLFHRRAQLTSLFKKGDEHVLPA